VPVVQHIFQDISVSAAGTDSKKSPAMALQREPAFSPGNELLYIFADRPQSKVIPDLQNI